MISELLTHKANILQFRSSTHLIWAEGLVGLSLIPGPTQPGNEAGLLLASLIDDDILKYQYCNIGGIDIIL